MIRIFLAFLILGVTGAASVSFADSVEVNGDALTLTCDSSESCAAICGQNTCEVARVTCEGCARASDPNLYAIFLSLHNLFEAKTSSAISLIDALKGRSLRKDLIAIAPDSALNIYSDPFDASEVSKVRESFASVCGAEGRNFVLAEAGVKLTARAIICEDLPGQFSLKALSYRQDYLSEKP